MPEAKSNFLPTPGPSPAPASLFESTSEEAGHVAARFAGHRYLQILTILYQHPACIFEIAAAIGCHDHQISGRFGELVKHNLILRTGIRREKPATGCQAEEYAIALIGIGVLIASSNPVQTSNEGSV